MAKFSVGIDIGGTFTDIVFYDHASGRHINRKVLTTHDDPSRAVIEGMASVIRDDGVKPATIERVVHATTLFTNALIERKGAKTGMVTTRGFRDVLEIARERKYEIYDIFLQVPAPIVPRDLVAEVDGRIAPDGTEEIALDEKGLLREVGRLVEAGVESVAIVFLHSYVNPGQERRAVAAIAAKFPDLAVSASCDVAPEIREYERASTTAINAYIQPLARLYLDRLAVQVMKMGIPAPLFMMLSNGGITHLDEAKRVPVQLLESGPAAGALAAAFFGRNSRADRLLAFDMGGTTAKLSVVDGGEPLVAYKFEAARQKRFAEGSGMPVKISVIELIEIGAGGGSLAAVDDMDLLKVGPRSAGSMPGPASYGRGGTDPAVTDANFILGYLNPTYFAGGTMAIDMDAATRALGVLAKRAKLSIPEVAWGVYDVVNENMASAARVHVAERGKDAREYALLPTGGGGPLHSFYVASKLGVPRIICPPAAGVASALGLLMAPARVDRAATFISALDSMDWKTLESHYRRLEKDAKAVIAATGLDSRATVVRRLADMRYIGQGFELVVTLPDGPYTAASREALIAAFEKDYVETFSRKPPAGSVEIVNVRLSAQARATRDDVVLHGFGKGSGGLTGKRPVYFPEYRDFRSTPVYDRYQLPANRVIAGPGIVEERESTLVVGPGAKFKVEPKGNLVVDLPSRSL